MILFLHNRYRSTGGEEQAVADTMWLVREHLGEEVQLLQRDSALLGRSRAAVGLLRGGLDPEDVAAAVRRTGARIVHAHNLQPSLGWRALQAARDAGAAVVVHLHQYRLVCAVGVCFTDGAPCTRCHGRNTLPGVLHNCRGHPVEAAVYAASLAIWQRQMTSRADAYVVPSRFAAQRLATLGAAVSPLHVVPHPVRAIADVPAPGGGGYALIASRLAAEKGVGVAVDACRSLGLELVIAGDGPLRAALRARAGPGVSFTGRVSSEELAALRARAELALVPSLSEESFGLAAAEAMAAGLPVAGSRIGALSELLAQEWLAEPGNAAELAGAIQRILRGRAQAGEQALARIAAVAAPEVAASALGAVYDGVRRSPGA